MPEKQERIVPHNIEAEQALLGAILINNDALDRVTGFLTSKNFYLPAHQRIFDVSAKLARDGKIANAMALKTYLPPDLDIGGDTVDRYLTKITAEATTVINAAEYGRIIHDHATRRNLIALAEQVINESYDPKIELSPAEQVEEAERRLFQLAETGKYGKGFVTFEEAVTEAVDMAARAYQRDGNLSGLPTGLTDLDGMMGGMQNSDLIVLGGRPGMGKTALATGIAYNVASHYQDKDRGGVVGFFSLEMSAEQLATRIISERAEVSSHAIRRGKIEEDDFNRIRDAAENIARIPLHIDEAGGLTIAQLAARARRLKRQQGLSLIVVDYIQLLRGSGRRSDNRVNEVTEITTGLKALAKELSVPVLALSQLSRVVEQREDKRPQLSDLRESGSIEQDADVVMFIFREEYYLDMHKPSESDRENYEKWSADRFRATGKAEVIIGKQRHGPTGTVELQFDAKVTRFADLAHG